MHNFEQERLEKYALAANQKILTSQSDLDPKDRAMPEMLTWCRQQQGIVVLHNGLILTNDPASRKVQNCKAIMMSEGIRPGQVIAANSSLITMLLENAEEINTEENTGIEIVSTQQQRLRLLVKEALGEDASDIHIEVRPDIAKIRFRRHGELYLHAEWLPKLGREIASVAFNKETDHAVTHFNPLTPQTASMPLRIDDRDVRLRLASLPAHGGFDVVMRILTTGDDKIQTLDELGYLPEQIALIKKAVEMPHGAVILSGPTGSGKTTTLASCLRLISSDRKVYTIEDPVEKVVDTITQVPVHSEQFDRSFASMGRSALRMDPQVIVLGEMRDEGTATVMTRAAITGHLVFSTLHTNSAPAIVTRLLDIGISPTLLGDPNLLTCLICQRLIPVLCDHCAIPATESTEHQKDLEHWRLVFGENVSNLRVRGKRCKRCKNLGIRGRTVVAEIIWIDGASRHFIQNADILGWEEYLKEQGWTNYASRALDLVRQGICDPTDAEKMIGAISPTFLSDSFDYRKEID